jgi:hypothetical protein
MSILELEKQSMVKALCGDHGAYDVNCIGSIDATHVCVIRRWAGFVTKNLHPACASRTPPPLHESPRIPI